MEPSQSFDPERWWVEADVRAKLLPDRPPLRAGRYAVVRLLGAGGTGVVFEAHDTKLDRRVALKILRPHDDGAALSQRISKEARALARLEHPAVVTVLSVERFRGAMMIVMELLEGPSFARWLETRRPWRDVVRHFADVARGLGAAHRAGIVHGDVKPDNVLFGLDGRVRVADFGLAQELLSTHGDTPRMSGGTEGAMSPEQRAGEAIDARSDQYSLCVAWGRALERATGRPSRRITRAIARGRQPDPAQRWPSLDELLAAIAARPRWPWAVGGVVSMGVALSAWPADRPGEAAVGSSLPTDGVARDASAELEAIETQRQRAGELAAQGDVDAAVAVAAGALEAAETLDDDAAISRSRLTLAQLERRAGHYDRDAFATAYEEAAGAGNAKTAALAAAELAFVAAQIDPEQAVRWERRAALWFQRAGIPDVDPQRVQVALAVASGRAEHGELGPALATMLEVLERTEDRSLASLAHFSVSTVYTKLHRYRAAEEHARLALASNEDADGSFTRVLMRLHLGNVVLSSGRVASAAELLQPCLSEARAALGPGHRDLALVHGAMAAVHWQRGDMASLREVLQKIDALPQAEAVGAEHIAFVQRMRWRLALHDGRLDDAWHHALALHDGAGTIEAHLASARLDLAHIAAAQGKPALAHQWLARAADAPPDPEADVQRLVVRSRVAAAEGDAERATELANAAVELGDSVPLPLETFEARRWRADLRAQRGDADGAAAERRELSLLASR